MKQFLLAGDKLIPVFHQDSTCGLLTKHHERTQKFKEIGDLKHIYKNEVDEACFARDAAYSRFS